MRNEFLRPLVGAKPRGGKFLRLYAADLGRGPDGRWWVMADRTQAPSGAGYALENRLALSGTFGEAFGGLEVERLAGFFQHLREELVSLGQPGGLGVCVLTPSRDATSREEHPSAASSTIRARRAIRCGVVPARIQVPRSCRSASVIRSPCRLIARHDA